MRIIAGKYKGHQLVSFNHSAIRPTTDRVKETIFNILQGQLDGVQVLDLFSGTGNLGLEALSRGAAHVTFVEKSKKSIHILEQNISKLKLTEPYRIENVDALKFIQKYQSDPFDIILIDPPFTEKMAHEVLESLFISSVLHENSVVVIESSKHERLDEIYNQWVRFQYRNYGDKNLSLFEKKVAS